MYVSTSEIVQKANSIVAQCGTRDPLRIARDLGIEVMYYPFNERDRRKFCVIDEPRQYENLRLSQE